MTEFLLSQGEVNPAEVAPSTFLVETGLSSGTAFLIETDIAVTAAHVIEGHNFVGLAPANLADNFGETVPSYVVYVNKELDLAVLRLLSPSSQDPLELADSFPEIGADVLAFGAPGGVYRVTEGSILDVQGDSIISSTEVAPGNSGGPLVDSEGDVSGVIIQYDPLSENAVAVVSTTVTEFIESIPEEAWSRVPSTTNEPLIVAWFLAGFLVATLLTSLVIFFVLRRKREKERRENLIKITFEGE